MKIKYIDTLCTNGTHLIFNATLLAMFHKISDEVVLYGEKENVKQELQLLEENQVATNKIKVKKIWLPIATSRISNFFLYVCSFFYNLWFVIFSKKDDLLVFNYSNLLSVRTINFVNKAFHRKILIFCHGEMEYLKADYSFFGIFNRLLFRLGRQFFLNKNIRIEENLKFVVLGESILNNIYKLTPPNISKSFVEIDHPYFFKNDVKQKNDFIREKLKVGTVGLFYKVKGADEFCEIVSLVDINKIEFSITGKIFYDITKLQSLNVDIPTNKGMDIVPRDELERRIADLDFILYLYPSESYQLMASGAILDALSLQKPIIALKNNYFEYIFSKFGHFGYLFDSVQDIVNALNSSTLDSVFDYQTIQNKLSVETISENLKTMLIKIGFIK